MSNGIPDLMQHMPMWMCRTRGRAETQISRTMHMPPALNYPNIVDDLCIKVQAFVQVQVHLTDHYRWAKIQR